MSNKNLIIFAEKPSQAKAYADAYKISNRTKTHIELSPCNTFPDGATITWGIGHLVSLKMPQEYKEEWGRWSLDNLPIIPDKFESKVTNDKKEQFNAVKSLFKECQKVNGTIVNAVDIDREGSNIFYSTLHLTGVKNVNIKRLWINSLEEDVIREGFKNLLDNKKDLLMYEEAKARQQADWLVGINASQLFSLLLQKKGLNTSLSVGRVQSPTVYMIYQRQLAIENFKSEPFYELEGKFNHSNGEYKGKAKIREKNKDVLLNLLKEKNIENLKTDEATIKSVSKTKKTQKSPKLHSLSTLQTKVNEVFKYSPSKVLEIVQSLYEKKILSYPRTDSNYITESEFNYLKENINEYMDMYGTNFQADLTPKKRYVNSKNVEEHYAIIPTKTASKELLEKLSVDEKNVFLEVLGTTLSMFHNDYVYEETEIITNVNNIDFFTKGKVEVEKGWKNLFPQQKNKDNQKTDSNKVLPSVSEKDLVSAFIEIKEGHTTPPKPFTEGQLINMMKTSGKTIENEDESEILKEVEGIGTEATRSGIIETIKKNDYIKVTKNIVSVTDKGIILCEAIEGNLLSSPSMTAKWESYLKKIGNGEGSSSFFLENITKFLTSTIENAPEKIKELEGKINEKVKSDSVSTCPSCDGSIIDKGKFYGCSGYSNGCKITFPKKWVGKNLTKKNIKDLCTKKETDKLKGFKSKKGKDFSAQLILNKEGKIEFNFN